jgi:hypothetical protein
MIVLFVNFCKYYCFCKNYVYASPMVSKDAVLVVTMLTGARIKADDATLSRDLLLTLQRRKYVKFYTIIQ